LEQDDDDSENLYGSEPFNDVEKQSKYITSEELSKINKQIS